MSYRPGDKSTGLRYREDTGIEHRCRYCPKGQQWWPLTDEFWDYRAGFASCRACRSKSKYQSDRRRLIENPERLLKFSAYQREYSNSARDVKAIKQRIRYWENPELYRAKARASRERRLRQDKAA